MTDAEVFDALQRLVDDRLARIEVRFDRLDRRLDDARGELRAAALETRAGFEALKESLRRDRSRFAYLVPH